MQWQFIFYLPFKTFRSKFYFSVELCQRPHVLPVYRKKHFFSPVQNEARTLFCRFFVFLCSYFTNGCDKSSYWNIWFSSWKTGNARLHKFLISLTQSINGIIEKIVSLFSYRRNLHFDLTCLMWHQLEQEIMKWRFFTEEYYQTNRFRFMNWNCFRMVIEKTNLIKTEKTTWNLCNF